MATVRELIVRFGFDVDEKQLKAIDEGVEKIKTGIMGIAGVAVGASVALFGMLKVSANATAELTRAANAAGVAFETYQKMGYAAEMTGSSIGEMGASLRVLSKNIVEADKNRAGELNKTFRKMGISVRDLNGRLKTSDEVFIEISRHMQGVTDPAKRTAIALDLLGKSGTGLLETLGSGPENIRRLMAEAEAFGVTTEENAKALGNFDNALKGLLWMFSQIRNYVAGELAPGITEMINGFRDWMVINKDLVKQNLVGFFKGVTSVVKVFFRFLQAGAVILGGLTRGLGGAETATKLFLWALIALGSISVVNGIMQLAAAFKTLGFGISFASWQATLIVAAIALVALAIEDIYTYFQGGDSMFGDWLKGWDIFIDKMKKDYPALHALWVVMNGIWKAAEFFTSHKTLGGAITGANDRDPYDPKNYRITPEMMRKASNRARENAGLPLLDETGRSYQFQNLTPGTAPLSNNNPAVANQISVQTSVVVPPGTPPAEVPGAIENGIQKGLETILGPAYRAVAPKAQ